MRAPLTLDSKSRDFSRLSAKRFKIVSMTPADSPALIRATKTLEKILGCFCIATDRAKPD